MSDRIHLAWCDQCGDEICEGDAHEVTQRRPLSPKRYTCERCIEGPRVVAHRVVRVDGDVAHVVVSVPGWDGSGRTGREET